VPLVVHPVKSEVVVLSMQIQLAPEVTAAVPVPEDIVTVPLFVALENVIASLCWGDRKSVV
jgi:hypothetical protein